MADLDPQSRVSKDIADIAHRIKGVAGQNDTAMRNLMVNLDSMEPQEKELFLKILEDMRTTGISEEWKAIWELDFDRQPVNFAEWVEDPYYMGDLKKDLYDTWKRELSYVLHPANGIIEWFVTGAIGGGKTYASLIAQVYKMYVASCLRDPQEYYGIGSNTEIVFGLFNTVLANAMTINFNQACRFINQSGYFRDHCPANVLRGKIEMPTKNMMMRIGSSELHALGSNLLSFMIDEVNFMAKPVEKDDDQHQAHLIYHATVLRLKSRYLEMGDNPGLACVVSSRKDQSAFLEMLMEQNRNNPQVHVSDYAVWETKGRDRYSPVEFRVAVGNRYTRSEVLDEIEVPTVPGLKKPDFKNAKVVKSKPVPAGMDWVAVPADMYFDFQKDLEMALRDMAGVATFGERPLIWRGESVVECRDPNRMHPFEGEWLEASMDRPDADLLNHVKWDQLVHILQGSPTPLYFPGEPRFVHVDLALTKNSAGIAMGCSYDKYTITERDRKTGQSFDTFRPKVWIDFMLQIRPVRGQQIDIEKIVDFILNMRHYGFGLQKVTFDGYASEMAIQKIMKANAVPDRKRQAYRSGRFNDKLEIETLKLSVDRDDTPYKMLRDALNCRAITYYEYPIFEDEVLKLEHDEDAKGGKGKVDHPPGGSKDVADAVCGVNYGIATSKQGYASDPVDGILRGVGEETIEDQMIHDITGDYVHQGRIEGIFPMPKQEPKSRKIYTGRRDWTKQLEGFGRTRTNMRLD